MARSRRSLPPGGAVLQASCPEAAVAQPVLRPASCETAPVWRRSLHVSWAMIMAPGHQREEREEEVHRLVPGATHLVILAILLSSPSPLAYGCSRSGNPVFGRPMAELGSRDGGADDADEVAAGVGLVLVVPRVR